MCFETSDCLHEEWTLDAFGLLEKGICVNAWKLEVTKATLKMESKIRALMYVIDSIERICEMLQ